MRAIDGERGAEARPPAPDDHRHLQEILGCSVPPPAGDDDIVAHAARFIDSEAFLSGSLGRSNAANGAKDGAALSLECLAWASRTFFNHPVADLGGYVDRRRERVLVRLTRLEGSSLQRALTSRRSPRLDEGLRAIESAQAAIDPLVRHASFHEPFEQLEVLSEAFCVSRGRAKLLASPLFGYSTFARRILLSDEFSQNLLDPLRAGEQPQELRGDGLDAELRARMARIFGATPAHARSIAEARSWRELAAGVVLNAEFVDLFISKPLAGSRARYVADALLALVAESGRDGRSAPSLTVKRLDSRRLKVRASVGLVQRGSAAVAEFDKPVQRRVSVPLERTSDGAFESEIELPVQDEGVGIYSGRLTLEPPETPSLGASILQRFRKRPKPPQVPFYIRWSSRDIEELDEEPEKLWLRFRFLESRGRYAECSPIVRQAIEIGPRDAVALLAYAEFLAHQRALGEAEALVSRALGAGSPDPAALHLGGRVKLGLGRLDEARDLLSRSTSGRRPTPVDELLLAVCSPPDAPSRFPRPFLDGLGRAFAHGAVEPGAAPLDSVAGEERRELGGLALRALLAGFASPDVLMRTASAFDRAGDIDLPGLLAQATARQDMRVVEAFAGACAPDRTPSLPILQFAAKCLVARGDPDAALAYAEEAVRRAPSDFETLYLAANINRTLRRPHEARALYLRALALQPDHEQIIDRLIRVERDITRKDPLYRSDVLDGLSSRLLQARQRDLFRHPADPATRFGFGRALAATGRHVEATQLFEDLVEAQPDWIEPIWELIWIAQRQDDHAGALRWVERLSELSAEPKLRFARIRALRMSGQPALVVEQLDGSELLGSPEMKIELLRSLFMLSAFDEALEKAERWLAAEESVELRMLAAGACLELGRIEDARKHCEAAEANGGTAAHPLEMPLFQCAIARKEGRLDAAAASLDPMFRSLGVQPVRLDASLGAGMFDQLVGGADRSAAPRAPSTDDPLVSVVMTTYDAQEHVSTAVRSILDQTYRNLELIIVDDCSADGAREILSGFEARDPRVRVIRKSTNDGTYVSKNTGLLQTRGEIIALQDSDDWSHPDRIAKSVEVLKAFPDVVGLTTDWLRMTSDGEMVIKAGGQIAHLCCISLVFRKAAMTRIGFFDSVRIAADLEFIQRMRLAFGEQAVPRLKWPLLFGRARSGSLTASEEFGMTRLGFSEPRRRYHDNSEAFHRRIMAGESGYMPFPLSDRKFEAPAIILPDRDASRAHDGQTR